MHMHKTIATAGTAFGAALVVLLAASCGSPAPTSPTNTAAPVSSVAPATTPTPAAPTPAATSPTGAVVTGGMGDTTGNPDLHYACAAQSLGADNATVLAYLTVAGTNKPDTDRVCATSAFTHPVQSIPGGTVGATADCWTTTADGGATVRLYAAQTGNSASTQSLCSSLLSSVGQA